MSNPEARSSAERDVVRVLPESASRLERLRVLAESGQAPTVTVVGKYNHGKSRLLNELIGRDEFAVADKRQTVALAERVHEGVRWLDSPGLAADIGSQDDRHAMHAAWRRSDVRLFVHTAKEGELDGDELTLVKELHQDDELTRRKTLFVLAQVDQLPDDDRLEKVIGVIRAQAPGLAWHPISATRHRQGMSDGKQLLIQRSGIPALKDLLAAALGRVTQARAHETALLFSQMGAELHQLLVARREAVASLRDAQTQQRREFDEGLQAVLDKVQADLLRTLDVPGPDHALTPDTAADIYRMTAGKTERARIQIAYSRGCIEIDGFLAGHGAIGLPSRQQVPGSLNTVMVAVLGVSVKHRDGLRKIFGNDTGIRRLRDAFTHYYELSADRVALAERVADAESALDDAERAAPALRALETAT
ncbi:MAG TPA: GTPase [Ilumatobacter sp.]|nr:GTPase [Ilumatobacter sp.]